MKQLKDVRLRQIFISKTNANGGAPGGIIHLNFLEVCGRKNVVSFRDMCSFILSDK